MANSYKQGRINEEIKRELALIIRDVKESSKEDSPKYS